MSLSNLIWLCAVSPPPLRSDPPSKLLFLWRLLHMRSWIYHTRSQTKASSLQQRSRTETAEDGRRMRFVSTRWSQWSSGPQLSCLSPVLRLRLRYGLWSPPSRLLEGSSNKQWVISVPVWPGSSWQLSAAPPLVRMTGPGTISWGKTARPELPTAVWIPRPTIKDKHV